MWLLAVIYGTLTVVIAIVLIGSIRVSRQQASSRSVAEVATEAVPAGANGVASEDSLRRAALEVRLDQLNTQMAVLSRRFDLVLEEVRKRSSVSDESADDDAQVLLSGYMERITENLYFGNLMREQPRGFAAQSGDTTSRSLVKPSNEVHAAQFEVGEAEDLIQYADALVAGRRRATAMANDRNIEV